MSDTTIRGDTKLGTRIPASVTPTFAERLENERLAVLADIAHVAKFIHSSHGMTYRAYVAAGGRYSLDKMSELGGWKQQCRAAGVYALFKSKRNAGRPRVESNDHANERLRADVLADIVCVADRIDLKRGMSYRRYSDAGGGYSASTIEKLGGWRSLCAAANVSPGIVGGQPKRKREWQKSTPLGQLDGMSTPEVDAALDRAIGWTTPPKGVPRIMGTNRIRGPRRAIDRAVHRETPVLERSEMIADIREVSRSVGLLSPQLLTWATYTDNGGRYRFDQLATLGGFTALRNAA